MKRYCVEERSDMIAVYDMQHPEYQETTVCRGYYPWAVAVWTGWLEPSVAICYQGRRERKAHELAAMLNENEQLKSEIESLKIKFRGLTYDYQTLLDKTSELEHQLWSAC